MDADVEDGKVVDGWRGSKGNGYLIKNSGYLRSIEKVNHVW